MECQKGKHDFKKKDRKEREIKIIKSDRMKKK